MTESSPGVSSELFRAATSRFASGVTIITGMSAEGPVGITVSAFSSVSLDPPLVLACIARSSASFPALQQAQSFGVSILSASQVEIAKKFATSGAGKFDGTPVVHGEVAEVPLIDGAIVQLECYLYDRHAAGDHVIFVGEVVAVHTADGRALLHGDRQFGTMSPFA